MQCSFACVAVWDVSIPAERHILLRSELNYSVHYLSFFDGQSLWKPRPQVGLFLLNCLSFVICMYWFYYIPQNSVCVCVFVYYSGVETHSGASSPDLDPFSPEERKPRTCTFVPNIQEIRVRCRLANAFSHYEEILQGK